MLDFVSWKDFALIIGVGCGAWYGYLLFTGKLKTAPNTKPGASSSGSSDGQNRRRWAVIEEQPEEDETDIDEPEEDELAPAEEANSLKALEGLADDLQEIIGKHAPNPDKTILLDKLQQEIARYPALNRPAFKAAISNLIIRAALADGGITVTRAEADGLWSHF